MHATVLEHNVILAVDIHNKDGTTQQLAVWMCAQCYEYNLMDQHICWNCGISETQTQAQRNYRS